MQILSTTGTPELDAEMDAVWSAISALQKAPAASATTAKAAPSVLRIVTIAPLSVRSVTADATLGSTDNVLLVDCSAGNVTVTLPPAALVAEFTVKRTDASANTTSIVPAGTDTIDGGTSQSVASLAAYTVVSNGLTLWSVTGKF